MISATLALQIPQLVDRMVLLCPTISGRLSFWINTFVSPITMLERFPIFSRLLSVLEPSMLYVTDSLMKPASFAERSAISEADYLRLRADARRPGQGRVRAECFVAMRNQDLSGRLRETETPALVIWGRKITPYHSAMLVSSLMSGAMPICGLCQRLDTGHISRRLKSRCGISPVTLACPRWSANLMFWCSRRK